MKRFDDAMYLIIIVGCIFATIDMIAKVIN